MPLSAEVRLARRAPLALQTARVPLDAVIPWIPCLRDERMALVLTRWVQGHSVAETGALLQLTPQRVRQILNLGLRVIGAAERGVMHPTSFQNRLKSRPASRSEGQTAGPAAPGEAP